MSNTASLLNNYDQEFYDFVNKTSGSSAAVIVPLVMDLLQPQSVIDVGCGEGAWLAAFAACGVKEIVGMDGDYVNKERMLIPAECFLPTDLSKPFSHPNQFSLVVSLEVAEHLPETSAASFVDSLVQLGDVILFSAAIPNQGGTDHKNEQWPDYWASLFQKHHFAVVDLIRPQIWLNKSVAMWYRQNILLFVNEHKLDASDHLKLRQLSTRLSQLSVVHPDFLSFALERLIQRPWDPKRSSLSQILCSVPGAFVRALRRRFSSHD